MPEAPRRAAPGGWIRSTVLRRLMLTIAAGSLVLLALPLTTSAAGSVQLSTPYPAVAVPPGEKASFKIKVATDVSDRVNLRVAQAPEGWLTSLRGEGFVVTGRTLNDMVRLAAYVPRNGRAIMQAMPFGKITGISAGEVDARLAILGLIWALVIGIAGGLFPAVRAARLPVASALQVR